MEAQFLMQCCHEPAQSVTIRVHLPAKTIEIRPHNQCSNTKGVEHAVHLIMLVGIYGNCDHR